MAIRKPPMATPKPKVTKPAQAGNDSPAKSAPSKAPTATAPASRTVSPKVVSMASTSMSAPEMKKQELIAKVVERSDIKKKFAKPVVEAMIDILGEALAEGRELNLQPLGKLKQNRVKETPTARIIVAKIRQSKQRASQDSPAIASVAKPE